MKTKQEILTTLKESLKNATVFDMANVSWLDQEGVLLSGNFIKDIIDFLEEKEYTAREWFNKAKDLGYDWADEAIERTTLEKLDEKYHSMYHALACSFNWFHGEVEEERCGNRARWHKIYDSIDA